MIFFRLSFCAAVLSFGQCSHSRDPDMAESDSWGGTGSPETVDISLAMKPTFGGAPAEEPEPPPPEPVVEAKPAKVAKPKAARKQPAKPKTEEVKTSSPPLPPMPKTKEPSAVDRSKLLNLMREPNDR